MVEFIDLAALLHTGRAGDHCVAARGEGRFGFSMFERDVAAWYGAFCAHAGARFGLYFVDSYAFAAALFGAWQAEKTVYLLADTTAANLSSLAGVVDGFAGDIPDVACLGPMPGHAVPAWRVLDSQMLGLVVYTSGSSGVAMKIPKRLCQLFDEVRALAQCFEASLGQAQVGSTVSHQHIYGLLLGVLVPLARGCPFVARRFAFVQDMAGQLGGEAGCVLITSPAHLKRLPEEWAWAAVRSSLRAVFSSGGTLSDEALLACLALLGQAPIEIYGSSETGGVAWRQRQPNGVVAWQPLPGVAIEMKDDALLARSAHTGSQDWQALPDRVRRVGSGFELLGRSDQIVKIEEKRVSVQALEQALLATGLLLEARVLVQMERRTQLIVVGVPSEVGWQLCARQGKAALSARLRLALKAVVEPSALPRRWRYVSCLPMNVQGKTTQAALLALFDPRRPVMRVLTRSAKAVSLQIEVAADSPYFDGHFADRPILAGVAQLEWVALFARELFVLPPVFKCLERVKFQQIIEPGLVVEMSLSLDVELGFLSFSLTSVKGSHASGRFVFGAVA